MRKLENNTLGYTAVLPNEVGLKNIKLVQNPVTLKKIDILII